MPLYASKLQSAVKLHQAGQLAEAKRLYADVLVSEPGNADAHHLLGLIALAEDDAAQAIERFRRAIASDPRQAPFFEHLGAALTMAGEKEAAIGAYRDAVRLQPNSGALHNELGSAWRAAGDWAEAEASYRAAVRLDPRLAAAHNNLGNTLQDQGRLAEALEAFRVAAQLSPEVAEIHFNQGNCQQALEQHAEAAAAYRRALAIRPDFALAHNNLGTALQGEKEFAAAADCYRQALRLNPEYPEALTGLGVATQALGQIEDAIACYRRALAVRPGDVTAQYNLATALQGQGQYDEAEGLYRAVLEIVGEHQGSMMGLGGIYLYRGQFALAREHYERVLEVWPDEVEAQLGRGEVFLARGDFLAGWEGFEYRLQCGKLANRVHAQPRWEGEELGARTLLVHAEYGFGDTMHFLRYLPLVRERAVGGRVFVEVHPKLIPLFQESGYQDLLAQGEPVPPVDVRVPLLSLPKVFGTTVDTIPCPIPYLFARPALVESWHERLRDIKGFRVGIHWQGNAAYAADRHRSMPLACFAPLAKVPGVRLISLQKETGSDQVQAVADQFSVIELEGLDETSGAFMDTAAVMKNLDLVVTSDSAVAHLAGAMGLPVWLAISAAAEWRWLLDREDSPWYPTMRLFRQTRLDEWADVFERIAAALSQAMSTSHPGHHLDQPPNHG